jgi:hypothetical protein
MSTVLSYLNNIKLSLSQTAYGLAALVITGLVVTLRLQGTKLHNTQVELLRLKYGATIDQQDKLVEAARAKFLDAMQTYEENK